MRWRKRGLVWGPRGDAAWARSHAFIPTADVLGDGRIRVYYTALDDQRFGRVGFVEVHEADPTRITYEAAEPVFDLGELGAFDDCGVNASCIVDVGGSKYLYYIGWQRTERVPHLLFGGLAVSPDGVSPFARYSRVPVFDRTDDEPFSRSAPYVVQEQGAFRAWYWSCVNWTAEGSWVHYNNVIRHATSPDGKSWTATPHVCVEPNEAGDFSIGRPWVLRDGNTYRMWYSVRASERPYRIGYAESSDGLQWTRRDEEVGIHTSRDGWDSEMICFPSVVDAGGRRYMFYNGNRHGAAGFGVAELESD